jgi:hypothetical protein
MPKYLFALNTILSLSVLIPFLTGLVKYKKLNYDLAYLVLICGFAFAVELVRVILLLGGERSFAPYNLFILGNFLFYSILFNRWGLFSSNQMIFQTILVLMILIWVFDMFIFNGFMFHQRPVIFRLIYSAVLSAFATGVINILITKSRDQLLKSPIFIVCCCVVVYFLVNIIIESFSLPKFSEGSIGYKIGKFGIRTYLNPIIYLVYTLVFLWAPTKKNFLQLS